jgi:hypothetical protein
VKPVVECTWHDEPLEVSAPAGIPRAQRRDVELSGYLIRSDKTLIDVKLRNLSYDGCAIETLVPLNAGEKVKLSVLGRGATAATVRWYSNRTAGLLFGEGRASRNHWPRKAERLNIKAQATLRRMGRTSYRVDVTDISRFGCSSEFVERPTIYENMWIKFDHLDAMESTVCWIEGSSLGLMYKNPIHPAVFDMLMRRLELRLGGKN